MRDLRFSERLGRDEWGWLSRRWANGLGFLVCAGSLGFALFAQFGLGIAPCPLCILQRLALLLLGVVFLAAVIHHPRDWGARVYAGLMGLAAGIGVAIATRHVWLQHLPPEQAPRCGPGLGYLVETLPLGEALREVLTGSGECAEVDWTLLGLSMPEWSLLLFVSLGLWGLWHNGRRGRSGWADGF